MTDSPAFVTDLIEKRAKAEAKVKRMEASLAAARKDFDELDVAVNVLTKHGYIQGDEGQAAPAITAQNGLNDTYSYLLRFVPFGEDLAIAPKEVTDMVRRDGRADLSGDYIRTALWRMGQRGVLEGNDGRYWRPKKEEAPDASTSGASETTGPVTGRERGYPPSTPEGSIPSGSTHVQAAYESDLDDDVPF